MNVLPLLCYLFYRVVYFIQGNSCSFSINNIFMFLVAWKNILVFFFSKKKVVQLLLVLCHLFDSLLPTDFISDIQNVKKKKTVLQNSKIFKKIRRLFTIKQLLPSNSCNVLLVSHILFSFHSPTIVHKIFGTDSSFHMEQCTTGKNFYLYWQIFHFMSGAEHQAIIL